MSSIESPNDCSSESGRRGRVAMTTNYKATTLSRNVGGGLGFDPSLGVNGILLLAAAAHLAASWWGVRPRFSVLKPLAADVAGATLSVWTRRSLMVAADGRIPEQITGAADEGVGGHQDAGTLETGGDNWELGRVAGNEPTSVSEPLLLTCLSRWTSCNAAATPSKHHM